jgi:hypothetical protein
VADDAGGTLLMSGPGFRVEDVTFALARGVGCVPGAAGDFDVSVTFDDAGVPTIDWSPDDAIALYVTDPNVTLPFGPGSTVTGGATYWVVATENFPSGFSAPVRFGEVPPGGVDDSETHGGPTGGAALTPGECYQFSIISQSFQTGTYTVRP